MNGSSLSLQGDGEHIWSGLPTRLQMAALSSWTKLSREGNSYDRNANRIFLLPGLRARVEGDDRGAHDAWCFRGPCQRLVLLPQMWGAAGEDCLPWKHSFKTEEKQTDEGGAVKLICSHVWVGPLVHGCIWGKTLCGEDSILWDNPWRDTREDIDCPQCLAVISGYGFGSYPRNHTPWPTLGQELDAAQGGACQCRTAKSTTRRGIPWPRVPKSAMVAHPAHIGRKGEAMAGAI